MTVCVNTLLPDVAMLTSMVVSDDCNWTLLVGLLTATHTNYLQRELLQL